VHAPGLMPPQCVARQAQRDPSLGDGTPSRGRRRPHRAYHRSRASGHSSHRYGLGRDRRRDGPEPPHTHRWPDEPGHRSPRPQPSDPPADVDISPRVFVEIACGRPVCVWLAVWGLRPTLARVFVVAVQGSVTGFPLVTPLLGTPACPRSRRADERCRGGEHRYDCACVLPRWSTH